MYVRIVTFTLDGPSHGDYEANALAIAEAFNGWPGLEAKVWLADESARRYGGVYVFASAADAEASRTAPELVALHALPVYTDLRVDEFDVLDGPTAVTGGPLAALVGVPAGR